MKLTKTKLHKMGYRLSKSGDCYWKTRRIAVRPEVKATVQVKLSPVSEYYDVTSIERGQVEHSRFLHGVRQLRQWEAFAFCT